jgi:pimeloyl-ACP methyl ester carboxylesterase
MQKVNSVNHERRRLLKKISGPVAILVIFLAVAYFIADDEKSILDDEVRSTLPGQYVKLPDGVVHYELAGPETSPAVVLVHGFSVPYYVWDPTFEALAGAGYRVLRYDLYGRGYSDRPEVEYDLDLFSGQLEGLLDALGMDEPVTLVGLSFGGPVVARYANRHPDLVRGLVLIDPQVSPVSAKDIFPLNVPLVGEYLMGVYMAPSMLPKVQSDDFYQPERFPDWEEKYRVQMQYRGFKRAILSTIRNMVGMDALAEYRALGQGGIPVMLVWGREDRTISTSEIEQVRSAIPGCAFHAVEGAGHLPHYEQAGTVNPLLLEFLEQVE